MRRRSHAYVSPAGVPQGSGRKESPETRPILDRNSLAGTFQDGFSEVLRAESGPQRRTVCQQVVRKGQQTV